MPIPVLLVRCESFTAWTAENSTAWIAPKQEYNTRFNPATRRELRFAHEGKSKGNGENFPQRRGGRRENQRQRLGGESLKVEYCRDTARDIRMLRRERQSARARGRGINYC